MRKTARTLMSKIPRKWAERGRAAVTAGLVLLLALPGCRRRDTEADIHPIDPTPEMEQAIAAAHDSMTAARMAAELTHSIDEDLQGNLKQDGCPEVTRTLTSVTLDYGTGCVPDSGLLNGVVAGSVTLQREPAQRTLTGTFDTLTYNGDTVDGTVTGTYTRLGGGNGIDLSETVDLVFNVGGTIVTVVQDLQLNVRATHVVVNGSAEYDDSTTWFDLDVDDIDFAYEDLAAVCPLPGAGIITVTFDTTTVTIEFHDHSPDTGYATVTFGPISGDVQVCEYLGLL